MGASHEDVWVPLYGHGVMPHDVWGDDGRGSDVLGRGAHSLDNTVHVVVYYLVLPRKKRKTFND